MTDNKKAAGVGEPQAASKSFDNGYFTLIRCHIKAAIVQLALWGLLPVKLAEWLIQRGGMLHG